MFARCSNCKRLLVVGHIIVYPSNRKVDMSKIRFFCNICKRNGYI